MQIQERIKHLLVTMLGALVIAGCSSTATEPVVEEQPEMEAVEVVEVVEAVKPAGPGFAADNRTPVDAGGSPVSRTFYFDFDLAVVSPQILQRCRFTQRFCVRIPIVNWLLQDTAISGVLVSITLR